MAFSWYTSPERYHEAAKIIFAKHVAQNVKYVETSFASGVVEFGGLNGKEILNLGNGVAYFQISSLSQSDGKPIAAVSILG
jgi:hypothetical protein